ncbi:MAG TPA: N-acetylneuraminate synthase [Terriglobales bacterium]
MVKPVFIGTRPVGPGLPCLVIAEAGVNHNGSLDMALRLVDAAVEAGADIVKFQTFKSEEVVTPLAPKADYQVQNTGASESQLDMIKKLELPDDAFRTIQARCRERGITFLSTPFDPRSADLLEEMGVAAFKVASGEITNHPFLSHVARKGRPLIVSTGMSNLDEVAAALDVIYAAGNTNLVLLHCVSNYPAAPASVNLRAVKTLEERFNVPVGYSDHTEGIAIAIGAAALGACVVEKHFTLDRTLPGPDHRASLEPRELVAMVKGIRDVQSAVGDGVKRPVAEELSTAAVARRSLVAAHDLLAGTVLTDNMVAIRRPGTGLPPSDLNRLVGRQLKQDLDAGDLFTLEMLI